MTFQKTGGMEMSSELAIEESGTLSLDKEAVS